ncbi:hypothetical protein A8L45_14190 [Veronia pacifica]|uniref:Lipoprotein n=1 Tax=Veronia pacifica TaxID=1080227 RepID=A0A1C3EG44_9GAMM|nr:hypothetical protein A8L45_14190 [Veronia pacifica]
MHIILLSALLFSVSGCKYRLAYNTAPFWSKYLLSDYIPMTNEQEEKFERDVNAFQKWHRKHELPNIYALLEDFQANSNKPLDYNQIVEYNGRVNKRVLATMKGLTPALASLFASLSDQQVTYLLDKINEDIEESREKRAKRTEEEAISHWSSRMEKRAKFWLKDIDIQQQKLFDEIAGYYLEMLPLFEGIADTRLNDLKLMLASRKQPGLEKRIDAYLEDLVMMKIEDQQALKLYNVRRNEVLFRMDRHLSEKQRGNFRENLAVLSKDISQLMKD